MTKRKFQQAPGTAWADKDDPMIVAMNELADRAMDAQHDPVKLAALNAELAKDGRIVVLEADGSTTIDFIEDVIAEREGRISYNEDGDKIIHDKPVKRVVLQ